MKKEKFNVVYGFGSQDAFDLFGKEYFESNKKMKYYAAYADKKGEAYIKVMPVKYREATTDVTVYVNLQWFHNTTEDTLSVFYNELCKDGIPTDVYYKAHNLAMNLITINV